MNLNLIRWQLTNVCAGMRCFFAAFFCIHLSCLLTYRIRFCQYITAFDLHFFAARKLECCNQQLHAMVKTDAAVFCFGHCNLGRSERFRFRGVISKYCFFCPLFPYVALCHLAPSPDYYLHLGHSGILLGVLMLDVLLMETSSPTSAA